jgi:AcrR family transcriptional regulator
MTRLIDNAELMTRQRLLEAAGEVFAERGFREATVRDICQRAGANIAAIKYHFGDKEKLYAAAVRYAHQCATRHPDAVSVPAAAMKNLSSQERLRMFVRGFFIGILEEGKPAWHAKLMAREMFEPTAVLDEIAATGVKPRVEAIGQIVREIIGPGASKTFVHKCARSIVGQILFYHFARPMLERVFAAEKFDSSRIDELTDHVTAFSLAGLEAMRKKAVKK